jgi:hypothetical protein
MPKFDAIFITPDGRVLYSHGLEPPSAPSTPPKDP